ncbi:hypothetical protein [Frondihabitans sp. PAMC 28766]|uniref:hypothetical protein n=1 Tax=Frondihabitans sp. PAMC 28766 TaxID=1795630 RepID=UPI0012FFD136|nr:hypothetical protein [Frondihabitans sp. PAMC 28766]
MNPLIPTPGDIALIAAFLVPIGAAVWALALWLSVRGKRRRLASENQACTPEHKTE